MRDVTKEIFLNTLVCPTLGWVLRNEDVSGLNDSNKQSAGERFRKEQGIEIGRRARSLYPEGILVSSPHFAGNCRRTEEFLSDSGTSSIFEGAFQIGVFRARADILIRHSETWKVSEVKSNANLKPELVDDLAYTAMVLGRCGLNISGTFLLLISRDYRLGMDSEHLFVESDLTEEVIGRAREFAAVMGQVDALTSGVVKPAPELKLACRNCPLFHDCTGTGIDHHIFEIPRLSEPKFNSLKELQVFSVLHLPDDFALTENQRRTTGSVKTGHPYVADTLAKDLQQVEWPAHYLDFEVASTGIPLYPDVAPYARIPFQYSVHKCNDLSQIAEHKEYLADGSMDPRREFAVRLINDLVGSGSILVYTNYEKQIIEALASHFPDLSDNLNAIVARLVDLNGILTKNYYHPEFHGSTSLKTILPVMVPELSYEPLTIDNGESAMAEFALLAMGAYSAEEAKGVRTNLLEYCKMDTLALVKLHAQLVEISKT